jgi:glutamyl-tRNA reductase
MLIFVGVSHRSAPVEVRERCAVPGEERSAGRRALRQLLGPVVLLSTCGRTEVYADVDAAGAAAAEAAAGAWLTRRARLPAGGPPGLVESARGDAALRRLLRVACGLESVLEGEDEILGQTRRAWLDAGREGVLSPALDAAFRLAVRTGRQARRLGDGERLLSLADLAAARVALVKPADAALRVVIAGTGPMGCRAALALRARFGEDLDLTLAGRTRAHVAARAAAVRARPALLADLPGALAQADAAIVALRARAPLVTDGAVGARPPERPLLVVDLSLPRAVDPSVAAVAGVTLRDVDHITAGEGDIGRWDAADRAHVEGLVEQAIRDFAGGQDRSDALATLASLRMQADGIRRAQVARTLRRLPSLEPEERRTLDALSHAIVNRLLHTMTLRLRKDDAEEFAAQVRAVFGME